MQRFPRSACALVVVAAAIAGCGGSGGDASTTSAAKAPQRTQKPAETPCAQLRTKAAARRVAVKLVDRVVAPDGQPERQTIGIIAESLWATCRQPRLPGVEDVAKYRPVRPVLNAIQRDFDEEAISGG
jgi:hypothetical protein